MPPQGNRPSSATPPNPTERSIFDPPIVFQVDDSQSFSLILQYLREYDSSPSFRQVVHQLEDLLAQRKVPVTRQLPPSRLKTLLAFSAAYMHNVPGYDIHMETLRRALHRHEPISINANILSNPPTKSFRDEDCTEPMVVYPGSLLQVPVRTLFAKHFSEPEPDMTAPDKLGELIDAGKVRKSSKFHGSVVQKVPKVDYQPDKLSLKVPTPMNGPRPIRDFVPRPNERQSTIQSKVQSEKQSFDQSSAQSSFQSKVQSEKQSFDQSSAPSTIQSKVQSEKQSFDQSSAASTIQSKVQSEKQSFDQSSAASTIQSKVQSEKQSFDQSSAASTIQSKVQSEKQSFDQSSAASTIQSKVQSEKQSFDQSKSLEKPVILSPPYKPRVSTVKPIMKSKAEQMKEQLKEKRINEEAKKRSKVSTFLESKNMPLGPVKKKEIPTKTEKVAEKQKEPVHKEVKNVKKEEKTPIPKKTEEIPKKKTPIPKKTEEIRTKKTPIPRKTEEIPKKRKRGRPRKIPESSTEDNAPSPQIEKKIEPEVEEVEEIIYEYYDYDYDTETDDSDILI
ncbi:hypothetical protein P9112_008718 [Eukaryota sp. TZLM1-RC]